MKCFRCAGDAKLDHAPSCPHRETPVGPVVELQWPIGDDGKPVSLERAIGLAKALDGGTRSGRTYWVEFTSTDDVELDDELRAIEAEYYPLGVIQRYCQLYGVTAIYGDGSGTLGAVKRDGVVVPGAERARDVALTG
jgi:hypothetical protein